MMQFINELNARDIKNLKYSSIYEIIKRLFLIFG
jgi:hypothetical protein